MDENRIEGTATNIGGKIKDAAGGLLGDSKLQGEGKADQVSGQVQDAYGSAKDSMQDGLKSLGSQLDDAIKNRPFAVLLGAVAVGYVVRLLTAKRS